MTAQTVPPSQTEVLAGFVQSVRAMGREGRRPVAVFDLDDTLLSTARRHLRILQEYAEARPLGSGAEARVADLGPADLHYSIVETAKAAGIAAPEILDDLRKFWFERFFKNDYLLADEPVPGAVAYVREVRAHGGVVVYMTGRDENMREGTVASLAKHGFPAPDGREVVLILKPRFDTLDLEYKTEALARVKDMGAVAGGFENEPAHVNLFHDAFPDSRMVLVETKHSGKPVELYPWIARIKDFLRP